MSHMVHSQLGASKSKQWLKCPGSIRLSASVSPEPESPYALEGTKAHELMEKLLKLKVAVGYPKEMYTHVRVMTDFVMRRKELIADGSLLVEQKVSLEHIDPEMYGTVDVAIVEEFGRLTIVDFKYGAGTVVEIKDNTQLIFYAIGAARMFDYNFEDVELVIIQPRAPHQDGIIRSTILTMDELRGWEEVFRVGVEETRKENASLHAGDHCKFCPAKVICPEISKNALSQAKIDFSDQPPEVWETPKIHTLNTEDLAACLTAFDKLEIWIDAVRKHAFARMERGEDIPGFKLVPKQARRQWTNPKMAEADAVANFGNKVLEITFLSPAQMEKIAGEDWVSKRVSNISSGLTLVTENDRRTGVNSIYEDFAPVRKKGQKHKPLAALPLRGKAGKTR